MALNPPLSSFKGKNIWIIGASSGIGQACAKLFFEKGAHLYLSARRSDALLDLQHNLNRSAAAHQECHVLTLDVTDEHSINLATHTILEQWSEIDVLLFVSGIYKPIRADQFDFKSAQEIINTNLLGPMRTLSELLPQFLKQGHGHIALVSSVAGYSGLPKSLVYGPSKAALINFAESLYYDLKPKGIAVHLISPGFVETPATAKNNFKMPALISASDAAKEICKGLEQGDFDIHFPKRFTRFLKFLRILPYPIYFWILKTFIRI